MSRKIIEHDIFPFVLVMACMIAAMIFVTTVVANAEYWQTVKMCDTAIECVSILCGK